MSLPGRRREPGRPLQDDVTGIGMVVALGLLVYEVLKQGALLLARGVRRAWRRGRANG